MFNANETITIKYAKVDIFDVRGRQVEKFNRLAAQYYEWGYIAEPIVL